METLLTFSVAAKLIKGGSTATEMITIKCIMITEKLIFLVDHLDGSDDILVLKNKDYQNVTGWKADYEYFVETKQHKYYFNIDF